MASTVSWIGAQYFHEETAACDFFDGFLHPLFLHMPFDIDEENVLPGFSPGRTRFDLGHTQAVGSKRSEKIVQRADFVFH